MQLTPHFDLSEFTLSQVAARQNLDNTPPPYVVENLQQLAEQLELVRGVLCVPLHISSGYRSPQVNRAVGGAKNSQHTLGCAADFTAPKFGTPREVVQAIVSSGIAYDQVILEFDRWVHFSYTGTGNRQQALVIDQAGTRPFTS